MNNNTPDLSSEDLGNIQHVTPINDIRPHSERVVNFMGLKVAMCDCAPKMTGLYLSPKIIFIHSSFDGREALEEALQILNNHE